MNPIIEMTKDKNDHVPLVELKQHLVIYVNNPPGPKSARRVYDAYIDFCGDIFKIYKSTFPCAALKKWTPSTRYQFEQNILPELRKRKEWGYGFSDDKSQDSKLFMFHGFRPYQQPNLASFYRFEFDWQVNSDFLRGFAEHLSVEIPFLSGYGGYFLQGRPSKYRADSYSRIWALVRRFWGCEVADIEVTAAQMKKGYKCVSWLTMIGEPFHAEFHQEIAKAKSVAYDLSESRFGILLQAAERPVLGDRNRNEDLEGYIEIAKALLPLQCSSHEPFGNNLWTEENTMAWLRRFTHPDDV